MAIKLCWLFRFLFQMKAEVSQGLNFVDPILHLVRFLHCTEWQHIPHAETAQPLAKRPVSSLPIPQPQFGTTHCQLLLEGLHLVLEHFDLLVLPLCRNPTVVCQLRQTVESLF